MLHESKLIVRLIHECRTKMITRSRLANEHDSLPKMQRCWKSVYRSLFISTLRNTFIVITSTDTRELYFFFLCVKRGFWIHRYISYERVVWVSRERKKKDEKTVKTVVNIIAYIEWTTAVADFYSFVGTKHLNVGGVLLLLLSS